MVTQYRCQNERRLQIVRTQKGAEGNYLNGIDYLEVAADRKTLSVHLLHELTSSQVLTQENMAIARMGRLVQVDSVSGSDKRLSVRLKNPGDRSAYTLRLIESPAQLAQRGEFNLSDPPPPQGFDPQLSQVAFSFRSDGVSEFDCESPPLAQDKVQPPPAIDYLAKDYASFRQLMLDRLAVTLPQWRERSPADIGMMLVELLAYAADQLSYYQDAVATEAYLGTARQRASVRRHARLLDYFLHDGSNARVWIALAVSKNGITLLGASKGKNRRGTQFLTRVEGRPTLLNPKALRQDERSDLFNNAQVFETLHDLTLYQACNEMRFYTWGEEECYLPIGSVQSTLEDTGGQLEQFLTPGRVLILEEKRNPHTGEEKGADPSHRHVVRLRRVTPKADPLFAEPPADEQKRPQRVLEIEWFAEDALPFSLCVSTVIDGKVYRDVAIACGNVVLADHGRTLPQTEISQEDIEQGNVPINDADPTLLDETTLNLVPDRERYRPRLQRGPLTQQGYVVDRDNQWVLFAPQTSASAALRWELKDVQPSLILKEYSVQEFDWTFQRDLLNSDPFARDFVVETEDDGQTFLRFGDNVLGKHPDAGTYLQVTYRIGNGQVGNVGSEAIAHIFTEEEGIVRVRNPLPARGGIEPEPIDQVRLNAPQAFRVMQRAVTEADYAEVTQRHREVQRAVATRRWTGSWYTIFISVDRQGGRPLDPEFKHNLLTFLEGFRMAGHDLEIEEPHFVPLDIAMTVQVAPEYFRNAVKQALLDTFSNRVLPNGKSGFFAPDQLSFGEPIYLSQAIETAMQVEGIRSVQVTRFQRRGTSTSRDELKTGQILFAPVEIARLDNDPTAPERGRLEFEMQGGL